MLTATITPCLMLLLAQQSDQPNEDEIRRAIEQDAAAQTAAAPATGAGSPKPEQPAVMPEIASPVPTAPPSGFSSQQNAMRPGSSVLNPAASVILDTSFGYYGKHRADFAALGLPIAGDDPSFDREGFGLQEIELAFQSAIDPYLDGAVYLTIPNVEGIEVEEAYLVTTSLPLNLQVKAGTFRSQVGRNNGQHLHMQYFTRRPLMTSLLFGADGMRGIGAQASVLLPLPWFTTLYAEGFSLGAPDQTELAATFGGGRRMSPGNLTYSAVLEQYWDLTDDASLLLGLNGATGRLFDCLGVGPDACAPGGEDPRRSWLYGADLTYHWKPANVAETYASVQWTTEFFLRTIADGGPTEGAGYTEPVVQLARRWYAGARFDVTGLPSGDHVPRRYGYAGSLTFAPSEFSRLRLYVQELTGRDVAATTVGFVQAEFSMGAHGAHPY